MGIFTAETCIRQVKNLFVPAKIFCIIIQQKLLPEQTSKYSNENLVRTPNHPVHTFFFFRYPSLLEDILEFQD